MTLTTDTSPLNGVDTATLLGTRDAVAQQHEIAKFQFRASNTWVSGTHSRTTVSGFHGAMQEMQHERETVLDSDHPAVLVGHDHGPTPVEYLLHAIASCLTAGIVNIAATRGVRLTQSRPTSRGTSTCSASSVSPTAPSATATSASGSPSASRATPTTRRCARSSSSHVAARPSTTPSPTRRPSRSTWSRADPLRTLTSGRPGFPAGRTRKESA